MRLRIVTYFPPVAKLNYIRQMTPNQLYKTIASVERWLAIL